MILNKLSKLLLDYDKTSKHALTTNSKRERKTIKKNNKLFYFTLYNVKIDSFLKAY